MGFKSLSLQMIPWCLHMMTNNIFCIPHLRHNNTKTCNTSIKVIQSDGVIKVYHKPINASELMLEFPKHLVCHSDSFFIGQKIPPLSENEQLQLGHKYFLLPQHFFQSVLSFVTIASFASKSPSSLKKATTVAKCQPFEIKKTSSGSLQIHVSDEFISKLMEQGKEDDDVDTRREGKICSTAALEKDYKQLVLYSRRQWQPKLDTIRESKKRKPIIHHRHRHSNRIKE